MSNHSFKSQNPFHSDITQEEIDSMFNAPHVRTEREYLEQFAMKHGMRVVDGDIKELY